MGVFLGKMVVVLMILGMGGRLEAADSSVRLRSITPPTWNNHAYSRPCTSTDLPGTWRLVTYASPYRFKNPEAAYLLPHQLFQFSPNGSMKSAHSARPMGEQADRVFSRIPWSISYAVQQEGLITVRASESGGGQETWRCVAIVQDANHPEPRLKMKRGDLVLTLLGKEG